MTSRPRPGPKTALPVDPDRSRIMRSVRQTNTGPEITVRRALHGLGLRFRLHRRDLPGTPDIVLPKYKIVIFVHGCFWHRHKGCRKASTPKTRVEFWTEKFDRNVERDRRTETAVLERGWRVWTIWECEVRNAEDLKARIKGQFSLD